MTDTGPKMALIGIGGCGRSMLKCWRDKQPDGALCIAVDRDKRSFVTSDACELQLMLANIKSKGSTVEYVDSVRQEVKASLAEHLPSLESGLSDKNKVILLAGLGGVIGTWASQILCNHLQSVGKKVETVLVMPFGFERERMKVAEYALPDFDGGADRLLCINDYLLKHTPEDISFEDALEIMNEKAFDLMSFP